MYDLIILGAGAAGLMAAYQARHLRVAVVDHAPKPGRKLCLAGGGMGNISNSQLSADCYVGENPAFTRKALRFFGYEQALALLNSLNLRHETREYDQLFGLQPAATLVDALLNAATAQGCHFFFGEKVHVHYQENLFQVRSAEKTLQAPRLLLCTGSPAWPQCGASDGGLHLARKWGHRIVDIHPALVPLHMPQNWPLNGLAGISPMVTISCQHTGRTHSFTRPLLFTHQGISGPAALNISCFWHGQPLEIDFLPAQNIQHLLHAPEHGKMLVKTVLTRLLPARLALALCPPELAQRKVAELPKRDRERLFTAFHHHTVTPTATAGLGRAEAARGGIATDEVKNSLESNLVPGLFFAGEILDITGLLGGYNLHWAWASAAWAIKNIQ